MMSTYNGAAHVEEQLDSVLAQDVASDANLSVYVRDDGSSDNTLEVLEAYEKRGIITLLRGKNLGVVGSFCEAIAAVPQDVDYMALCDQDDVWHADKLSRALKVLAPYDASVPALYWSEYTFCDANMKPQERSHHNQVGVHFATMLYENMASGNTSVINRPLADLIASTGAKGIYCHDWWNALLASAFGNIVYDDFSSLEYRRTGSNVSPTGSGKLSLLRYRVKAFLEGNDLAKITAQLSRFREAYGDALSPEKRRLLDRMLDGGRLAKAFVPLRLRQRLPDELAVRLLFLMGKL